MTVANALVIGHDHLAGLGILEPALTSRDVALDWFRVVSAERFTTPDVDVDFPDPHHRWDMIITLGAGWPRGQIQHWAAKEIKFLRQAHQHGVPILAICFGAQLLAEALGGTTTPLGRSRIGWRTLRPADSDTVRAGPWFCWNSEQVVEPPAAEVLATSDDGCEAFKVGRSVGVQFHPEMSPALLRTWLSAGAPDGVAIDRLHRDTEEHASRTAADVHHLLDALMQEV